MWHVCNSPTKRSSLVTVKKAGFLRTDGVCHEIAPAIAIALTGWRARAARAFNDHRLRFATERARSSHCLSYDPWRTFPRMDARQASPSDFASG